MSFYGKSEKRWLKAELHAHCSVDPVDYRVCEHTPEQLIARAAELGYEVLAITCHNLDIWSDGLAEYAYSLGITLIPGMEVTAEQTRHILVYNFHAGAEDLNTLKKIRGLAREDTMVIAPHPFFPGPTCLRGLLETNIDLFDAIESSGFHVPGLNFNRRGERLAERMKKPMVGNGDVHYLWQLGRTFTWIYSEPGVQPVLRAVKGGLVRVQKSPLSWLEAAQWWATSFWRYPFPVNQPPYRTVPGTSRPVRPSDEIEDGGCFGSAQEGVEP